MPSKKQRRRQEKSRRHEYVYVDEEGNEIEPAELRPAKPEKPKADARGGRGSRGRSGRPIRPVPPPSWSRVGKRALAFGPVMFVLIYVTSKRLPVAERFAIAALYTILFLPFFYVTDRFAYRAYLKRTGRAPDSAKPEKTD